MARLNCRAQRVLAKDQIQSPLELDELLFQAACKVSSTSQEDLALPTCHLAEHQTDAEAASLPSRSSPMTDGPQRCSVLARSTSLSPRPCTSCAAGPAPPPLASPPSAKICSCTPENMPFAVIDTHTPAIARRKR